VMAGLAETELFTYQELLEISHKVLLVLLTYQELLEI